MLNLICLFRTYSEMQKQFLVLNSNSGFSHVGASSWSICAANVATAQVPTYNRSLFTAQQQQHQTWQPHCDVRTTSSLYAKLG